MWHQALKTKYLSHSHLLHQVLFQECALRLSMRHATFMPSMSLLRKTQSADVCEKKKQIVLKKLETTENGRKMIQVHPPPFIMESQSTLLPGPERARGCGIIENPEKLIDSLSGVNTVCDVVNFGSLKSKTGECLGYRFPSKIGDYKWISYTEVEERSTDIGSGLINLGLKPTQKTMVGLCTKTRPEFILTMMACSKYSMVLVPLYNCFGPEAVSQIISQVDMEAVICETPELAASIIRNGDKYPKLKHIILIEDDEDELKNSGSKYNIMRLKELEADGKQQRQKLHKPKPEDLLCLCYTSGTTGEPKGVMVTHRNVLSCISSLDTVLAESITVSATLICYLPCAHIYEIINEIFCLYHGGRLGYYGGLTDSLLDDIQKLRPEIIPLVPKLMNLIHSAVRKQIVPFPIRKRLFNLALIRKEKELRRGIARKNTIYDRLFFSKIQERLGGRAQLIFSSSAPVCKEVMQFFRCAMGCLMFEVYGLSEVGASVMTLMSEDENGFVGAPLPCNHIKLASIPELSYYAEDNTGEICIRGSNVCSGYFKNPSTTQEAFDKDGWYHTGDIGKWNANGTLSIIDRKKHLFKMSQGEYIVPERTEGVYLQSPIVSQVYVDGNTNEDFIVGIVVPDRNLFQRWAKRKGFKEEDFETLCQNDDVRRAVLVHLLKIGKKKHLNSLQQIGNIYLSAEAFSQDNGLLTPTLKLKRSNARNEFEKVFEKLYEEGNLRKIHGL